MAPVKSANNKINFFIFGGVNYLGVNGHKYKKVIQLSIKL